MKRIRLMEMAGLLKEATTDRDAIAHFVWGQDSLMDKGEDDIEEIINQMEEEWEASKANYGNVEDYLEELENEGGMDMFMEGKKGATARLNEARVYTHDYDPRELVPRMEGMVNMAEHKKMIDSIDKCMEDWYREGFDKNDILNYFHAVLPEGPND